MDYDTEKHPRLKYDVASPVMGIGSLCIMDMDNDPMGVMLQGAIASDEIRNLRGGLEQLINASSYFREMSGLGPSTIAYEDARRDLSLALTKAHAALSNVGTTP